MADVTPRGLPSNIRRDHLLASVLPDRVYEVSLAPELPAPKLPLHLRRHYGDTAAPALVVYTAVGQLRRNALHTHSESPYFFYPANNWPHKNHERLLEAYANYRFGCATPWNLKLSGHFADSSRIIRIVERLGLRETTEILGFLPDPDFNQVFSSAAALLFPSRHEGFGIPLLEAFRLEVPVICSVAGSLPEIWADAYGYFDPDDVSSIAAVMERVSRDPAWRAALVAAGKTRASNFDLAHEADKLAQTFIEVARQS